MSTQRERAEGRCQQRVRAAASRWGPRPQPPLPAPTPCSAHSGQMMGTQPQHSILRSGRHLPTQAPCGHAARPTQSGTNGHMQTESRDSFIAPWEVTVGACQIMAACAVAGRRGKDIPEAQGRNSVSQARRSACSVAWAGGCWALRCHGLERVLRAHLGFTRGFQRQ